ncbi:hypothetical protein LJC48_02330 [Desulfovibrio sp. OttesenSCG-928-C06]|nr:hypothetical protein [Desulfovibrio sp. OttesenSCG-928-C06]
MKSKILICIITAVLLASVSMGGCNWMGRTAGKTKAAVEDSVDSMQQGYKDGYEDEKSK